mmetsp:Transcript_19237/g.33030  ORF Transcript_19237/g.33030 Transcript_19237/m.33030 type:complete len:91 (+) Transcript_19237:201-473(+)|eukprot:CAMPEP_0196663816 /NCGR_PEP_ID=MMETSP1086-20130531/54395_1 /TAXON_ID=77921 /ORGANISM="Cyanoptyche  gloeocystis , Strain SAG4.97" /LENGTH=90 /DNA_ID=CAMNT_0041999793 /DNA_START=200 /DNA_END=472 /DNA_ORIENTATION=-
MESEGARVARADEELAKARKHEQKRLEAEASLGDVQTEPKGAIDKMKAMVGMSVEQKMEKEARHQAADTEKHVLRAQELQFGSADRKDVS